MAATGRYEAACSIFSFKELYSPSAGVPYNMIGINHMQEHVFATPRAVPGPLVCCVPDTNFDPLTHNGAWLCASPEEVRFALWLAIERDILAGKDDQLLGEWLLVCLSTTVSFEILDGDMNIFWRNCALREEVATIFSMVVRTPRQRVIELILLKRDMEKTADKADNKREKGISASKLWQAYDSRAKLSPSNMEPMTETWVSHALSVYNRALHDDRIMAVVEACEQKWNHGSPFNSIYKLNTIVSKAGGHLNVLWVFNAIKDLCFSGQLDPATVSDDFLSGKRLSHVKCGFVDLMVYKKSTLEWLLKEKINEFSWDSGIQAGMRENLRNHEVYRSKVCSLSASNQADLSWMKVWPRSATLMLQFLEACAYRKEFDSALRNACKLNKLPSELMTYSSIKEKMSDIHEACTKESVQADEKSKGAAGASAETAGPEGATPSSSANAVGGELDARDKSCEYWRGVAERLVSATVTLVSVDNLSEAQLADRLRAANIPTGVPGKAYTVILYEVASGAEPITAPHLRIPPFLMHYMQKTVGALKKVRGDDQGNFPTGDVFIGSDAGNHGARPIRHAPPSPPQV